MSKAERLDCANKLEAAALVIQCGEGEWWTQGISARTENNGMAGIADTQACKFCMVGAYVAAGGSDWFHDGGMSALAHLTNDQLGIWNDAPGRTAREVASLMLDAADQLRGEAV